MKISPKYKRNFVDRSYLWTENQSSPGSNSKGPRQREDAFPAFYSERKHHDILGTIKRKQQTNNNDIKSVQLKAAKKSMKKHIRERISNRITSPMESCPKKISEASPFSFGVRSNSNRSPTY